MARLWAGLLALVGLLAMGVGCQSSGSRAEAGGASSAWTSAPAPSFEGPNVAPRSAPVVVAPKYTAPAPAVVSGPADWAPRVTPRAWRWIVIHHSASPAGSMAVFDREHKAKGW